MVENFIFELFLKLEESSSETYITKQDFFLFDDIFLACKIFTISHVVLALVSSQFSLLLVSVGSNLPSFYC